MRAAASDGREGAAHLGSACPIGFACVCEHLFVTGQGSAYTRLRRALDRRSLVEALSAASELEHVGLVEALCLLLLEREPARFTRAALRWHGRYCREVPGVAFEEAQAVLAALALLSSDRRTTAAGALAGLLDRRGFERAGEALLAGLAAGERPVT
jgi:hypothetical protein